MEDKLGERVASLETRVQEHDKKLDNLEGLTKATTELAFSVKEIASDMSEVKSDIKDTKNKVSDLENKPGKLSIKAWVYIGGILGSALLGYLFNVLVGTFG